MTDPTAAPTRSAADVGETRGVFRVPVAGGDLAVRDLNPGARPDAPLVLLVHGITANGATWPVLAAQLAAAHGDRVRVWAPDLRGRALSAALTQPAGIRAHVADLRAVLDHADAQAGGDGSAADGPTPAQGEAPATRQPGPARQAAAERGTAPELGAGQHPIRAAAGGDQENAHGRPRPVVVGHSMGGFVTALLAATHPDRVGAAVLVDGGFAFPAPPDLDVDAALAAVIGPAMDRLSMRFASPKAYLDFWAPHPAVGPLLAGPKADTVRAYLLSDLVPTPEGDYRSSCVADVVRADGADILADSDVLAAGRRAADAGVPLSFLWAARGLLGQTPGLYTEEIVAALALPAAVTVTAVPDVDHYGIVLEDRPVTAVREAVEGALR